MIKRLLWWLFLFIFFLLYLSFHDSLEYLTKVTIISLGIITFLSGGWYSTARYYTRRQRSQGEENTPSEDKCLKWSLQSELKYDLLGLFAFLIILYLGEATEHQLSVNDLAQAVVGLIAFWMGKKLLLSSRRGE